MPRCLRGDLRDISLLLQDVCHSLFFPCRTNNPTGCKLTTSRLEDAKLYGNTSESQAASYDRDHPLYPYKSHGQWLKACYGLVGLIILILFNGVTAFIEPFNIRKFVSAYISVSLDISSPRSCGTMVS